MRVKLKIQGQNIGHLAQKEISKIHRNGSSKKHVSDGCSFPCITTDYRSTTTANSNIALLLENSSSYNGGLFNATDES